MLVKIPDDSKCALAKPGLKNPDLGVFFVVGAPRSGTTLLRSMLSAHPRICIPHETEFFMSVRPGLKGRALRQAFCAYSRTEAFRRQEFDAGELLAEIRTELEGPRTLFLAMMRRHAQAAGKPRVGEKSPHHCRRVEEIAAELPGAKFIHIYRDVRDVAASRLLMPWSSRSVIDNARSWARIVAENRRLLSVMPPDRYTDVRFETLVAEPEPTLRRLCEFLCEPFAPEMLRFHERARAGLERGEAGWSGSSAVPLDGSAIGRHRSRLTDRQIDAIQRAASAQMHALGYERIRIRRKFVWLFPNAAEQVVHRLGALRKSVAKRLPRWMRETERAAQQQRMPGRARRAAGSPA